VYNINGLSRLETKKGQKMNVLGFVMIVIGLVLLLEKLDKKIKGPKRLLLMFVIGLLFVVGADLS